MENESLIADLLEWLVPKPRPYNEVMAAWRTSCPRLTIWEDTFDANFVRLERGADSSETVVCITEQGIQFLKSHGRCGSSRLLTEI